MYVPRSPLRRRLVPIATLVALTAGAGALGITLFSGGSPAAADPIVVSSPSATPTAPSTPTPQVKPTSSPTPTPTASMTPTPTSTPRESSTPKPKPTKKPKPTTTPSPTPSKTPTPSPRPTPTCQYDGVIYQVGDKQWGPYDRAGHRTQYMCSMTSSSTAGWVAIQPESPVGGACQTYGAEQSREDGYVYWCGRDEKTGKLLWTSTKPPAQDPGATPPTEEPSPGSGNHPAAR